VAIVFVLLLPVTNINMKKEVVALMPLQWVVHRTINYPASVICCILLPSSVLQADDLTTGQNIHLFCKVPVS
jgi:hypothetical protein